MNIASIVFTGANAGDFSQVATCTATLAANANCNIVVTFTPAASGSRSASLTVTDNSNNTAGSTQSSTLSGTGTRSVSLTWSITTPPAVLGYYVYRGTAKGAESSTPLNFSYTSELGYIDTDPGLTSGVTYYYYVTAVAADGVTQSLPSNEVSATVPPP